MFFKWDNEKYKQALKRKLDTLKTQVDTRVYIRDLFVYSLDSSIDQGEFLNSYENPHKKSSKDHDAVLKRMVSHVKLLAKIANTHHVACNNENKENSRNTITRLATHEFAFYTKTPLTFSELNLFLQELADIAAISSGDVHLLISSLAVMTNDPDRHYSLYNLDNANTKKVLNMSVYVQCGKQPIIHPFCKRTNALYDPYQTDEKIGLYYLDHNPYLTPFVASETSGVISYQSIFIVTTLDGGRYIQAIDICRDHVNEHAKEMLSQMVKQIIEKEKLTVDDYFPEYCDHLVSSNTVALRPKQITRYTAQVDPRNHPGHPSKNSEKIAPPLGYEFLAQIQKEIESSYNEVSLTKNEHGIVIENPIFGPPSLVVSYPKRVVEKAFFRPIAEHNRRIESACETRVMSYKPR